MMIREVPQLDTAARLSPLLYCCLNMGIKGGRCTRKHNHTVLVLLSGNDDNLHTFCNMLVCKSLHKLTDNVVQYIGEAIHPLECPCTKTPPSPSDIQPHTLKLRMRIKYFMGT